MNPLTYCKPIKCPRLEYLDERIYQWNKKSGKIVNKGNGHWWCQWSNGLAVFNKTCPMKDLWSNPLLREEAV